MYIIFEVLKAISELSHASFSKLGKSTFFHIKIVFNSHSKNFIFILKFCTSSHIESEDFLEL